MKEKYVKCNIKNFEHYLISNYGNVINTRRNNRVFGSIMENGNIKVALCNKDNSQQIMLHNLVLMHFQENEINLDYVKRGHIKRKNNTINKTKRGIYKWGIGKKKYRAVLAVGKSKKTLGYFDTEEEAIRVYKEEYYKMFGELPF